MSLPFLELLVVLAAPFPGPLRVCADPANLPFSSRRRDGFENRIAEVLARELGTVPEYTWWPGRRGFLKNTLLAHRCDVVIGMPVGTEQVRTLAPYYSSTYVFVTRDGRHAVRSFDDPALARLRIGVPVIGDDYANPPPLQALARRGITRNVTGVPVYVAAGEPSPAERLTRAVARGEVDVAILWGPAAGWYASRASPKVTVTPVRPAVDRGLPFTFAIALAVRPEDAELASRLDAALSRRASEVREILESYAVPLVGTPLASTPCDSEVPCGAR